MIKFKQNRGFTIIELLIAIFIFSTVMILASSSLTTSFLSGRTHSSSSMEANRNLSLVLDIIGQKMVNASGKNGAIYGFDETGGLLTIVLNDNNTCAYFKEVGDAIKMSQENCTPSPTLSEQISSTNITITQFDLSQINEWSTTNKTAPYITIKITGEDTKTGGKANMESTYSIPAYTYNKW